MYIEDNGETNTGDEGDSTLDDIWVYQMCRICGGREKEPGCVPAGARTQCNGGRNQQDLYDPVDAGIGIPKNDITHCIGKYQTGNQNHQCADDYGVGVVRNADGPHNMGGKSHNKGGCNGCKKWIDLSLFKKTVTKANQYAADTAANAVCKRTAKYDAKTKGTQKMAQ